MVTYMLGAAVGKAGPATSKLRLPESAHQTRCNVFPGEFIVSEMHLESMLGPLVSTGRGKLFGTKGS